MSDTDVKAGKYELVARQWDEIMSKPNEPLNYTRHRQGETVDLSEADAKRLVAAGAVVKPGEREKQAAELAVAQAQAALAALPDDVREQLLGDATEVGTSSAGGSLADSYDGTTAPGDANASAVVEFLKNAGDADRERVIAAEREGKNRKSIVEFTPAAS